MSLDIPVFTDAEVPSAPVDEAPPTRFDDSCSVCGKELHYVGRGRRPTKCDEHKKGGNRNGVRTNRLGKNEELAAQAAFALSQLNGLLSMGLMLSGLPLTAETLENARDSFREQAAEALLTDPELCRTILKGGTASGKVALIIAYGMLGAAVIPVGVMEFKEKRSAAKELEDSDADRSANSGAVSAA